MKILFIGGTGTISTAISRRVLELGWDLYLLNRGSRNRDLSGKTAAGAAETAVSGNNSSGKLTEISCDINADEGAAAAKIRDKLQSFSPEPGYPRREPQFDVVADFIAFTPAQAERDYRLFQGLTKQYIFISSASAYQKPLSDYRVSEATPLSNPFWEYSRDKIACEEFLMAKYREEAFPVTIVRPSHTYDERNVPLGVHGEKGSWQVIKRMIQGKPVIIQGDGTSLWTMTSSRDFARAFTGLMGNLHAIGEAVQITSDETVTWNQIYAAIAAALGVELKAVHVSSEFLARCGPYDFLGGLIGDKAHSVVFDNAKLKRLVPGFTAKIRFDQGIRETLAYVLAHKECQKDDPEFDRWCDRIIAAGEKALEEINAC
jgi:nucleoside-diphosphate-sugar epimerase